MEGKRNIEEIIEEVKNMDGDFLFCATDKCQGGGWVFISGSDMSVFALIISAIERLSIPRKVIEVTLREMFASDAWKKNEMWEENEHVS